MFVFCSILCICCLLLYRHVFPSFYHNTSLFIFVCCNSKKLIPKYILFITAGILLTLGFKLKATVAIVLIAMIIHLFLAKKY